MWGWRGISGSRGMCRFGFWMRPYRYAIANRFEARWNIGVVYPRVTFCFVIVFRRGRCKKDTFQNWLLRFGHVTRAVVTWCPNTGFSMVMCTKIAPWPSAVTSTGRICIRICKKRFKCYISIFSRFFFSLISDVNWKRVAFDALLKWRIESTWSPTSAN